VLCLDGHYNVKYCWQ